MRLEHSLKELMSSICFICQPLKLINTVLFLYIIMLYIRKDFMQQSAYFFAVKSRKHRGIACRQSPLDLSSGILNFASIQGALHRQCSTANAVEKYGSSLQFFKNTALPHSVGYHWS